jgi:membrane protein implicated in regulation of membrane protease activity
MGGDLMQGKVYTTYSIITTLLEEIALAAIVLWLLPVFGIVIPTWGLALMMIAWGTYSYISYRLCKKALDRKVTSPGEAMVGCLGKAKTCLDPNGIVQVSGELWKATTDSIIESGEDVIVQGIEGLTLFVTPRERGSHQVSSDTSSQ